METSTLYYREGSSDKVYHIEVVDNGNGTYSVPFAFGRRGSTLQKGFKADGVSRSSALSEYNKVVREKTKKGYSSGPTMAGVTSKTSTVNPESAWEEYLKMKAGGGGEEAEPEPEVEAPVSGGVNVGDDSGINPMLLNNVEDPLPYIEEDSWIMQEKHDGRRLIVRKQKDSRGETIVGINNSGKIIPLTSEIFSAIEDLKEDVILDGESIGEKFYVFDCLKYGTSSIDASTPFSRRAAVAKDICKKIKSPNVVFVACYETKADKQAAFNRIRDLDGEGVVFKNADGQYKAGRPNSGGNALKFKFYQTVTAKVLKQNGAKRSVHLGLIDDGDGTESPAITDVGKVTIPANYPIPKAGEHCEIRYLYAYRGGCLYQPIYQGVREDRYAPDKVRTLKFKPTPPIGEEDEPEEIA